MIKRLKLGRWVGLSLAGFAAHSLVQRARLAAEPSDEFDFFAQTQFTAHPGVDLAALNKVACGGRCTLVFDEAADPLLLRVKNCSEDSAEFRLADAQTAERVRRFVRPPKLVDAGRFKQFEETVRRLQADETVLFIYLPESRDAGDVKQQYLHHTLLYPTAEATFRKLASACDATMQCFVIKDEQVGAQLGLSLNNYGDVFAVAKEELLKGRFANDSRFGERLVWNKVSSYVDIHHQKHADILESIQSRVFHLASAYDLDRYREKGTDRDQLVIHSQQSQQTVDLIRYLDKHLDAKVDIVFTENKQLLEQELGIVPDNYIATCRFLRRPPQADSPVALLRYVDGKWVDSTKAARNRREHFKLSPDIDDIMFTVNNLGKAAPHSESSACPLRHSRNIDSSVLAALVQADKFSVVKFYRQDCLACERIFDLYEQLALTLKDKPRLKKLNLHHQDKLRDVEVCSFDLSLDTDDDIEVHKTPMILILGKNKIKAVDLFSEKFDLTNIDRIIYMLIRVIDDM